MKKYHKILLLMSHLKQLQLTIEHLNLVRLKLKMRS